jgi:hypothetical protein
MDPKQLKMHPNWSKLPFFLQHFSARIFLVCMIFGDFGLF